MYKLILSTIAAGMLTVTAASATCTQTDIAGKWSMYLGSNYGSMIQCDLYVTTFGSVAKTICNPASYNSSETNLPLTSGKFVLSNATRCTFKGALYINGRRYNIGHSSLSQNKDALVGKSDLGMLDQFPINMVRY